MVNDQTIKDIIHGYFHGAYNDSDPATNANHDWQNNFKQSLDVVLSSRLCIHYGISSRMGNFTYTKEYWKFSLVVRKFIERHPDLINQYEVMVRL